MDSISDPAPDGESRKRAAHRLLEALRERIVFRARRALLDCLLERNSATIDDVRAVVAIPAGLNPKLFGPVPGPLAVARIIRAAGTQKTGRAAGHARPITVWELIDRSAALAWLRDHPEPSDPEPAGDDPTDPFAF